MTLQRTTRLATALLLAAGATACAGGSSTKTTADTATGQDLKGQNVTVAAVWSGTEQTAFKKVLDAFTAKTGATTTFISTGDNLSTVVGSKIQGGDPADVVMVPQPGVLKQFVQQGWLEPLAPAVTDAAKKNFSAVWSSLGTVNGTQYGLYFKAADKSTIWYSPTALQNAGITAPPATFGDLLKDGKALADSGTAAFSVAGQAGWPLTDWFENVYLSQAGPDMYDKLARHEIPWTDPSVIQALTTLGQIFGSPQLVAGGGKGALQTDFPTSVQNVFGPQPKAAMTYEGDFVAGVISGDLGKAVGTDAKVFPFPSVGAKAPVMGGGDAAVVLKDAKHKDAAQKLLEFLASPEAAAVWAKQGGFLSPNKALALSLYPDDTTRQFAKSLIDAGDSFRFDMSDQAPAAFGGTAGAGEWKDLQDFLANPADPQGAAQRLEQDAAKAYKG
ncbi:ABC transporter substrate-binding protein [Kitasatospora sp. NPDC059571]|uniref:ABC transporter substrate-binding protein n=1 Tax=Kitasatospora sp. NPDC059571 TaxID=3346871 RepID=UPI0036A2CAB3